MKWMNEIRDIKGRTGRSKKRPENEVKWQSSRSRIDDEKKKEEMEKDERGWNETMHREERKKSLDASLVHELGQLR